jgi:hypothetical protein
MVHLFGIHGGHVDNFTINDSGNTVSFDVHGGDWYDVSSIGWVIKSKGTGQPYTVTDVSRSMIKGTMTGVGNGVCGVSLATASAPSVDNVVDVDITLGANATGFCLTANDATGPTSHNTITGHVAGTGAANQFVANVTDTLGGTVGNVFKGITAFNLTNGYVVGAGATGTQIIDPSFDTVTDANKYALSSSTLVKDSNGMLFADIPANLANGSTIFLTDATIANPCAGSGTGSILKQLNAVHVCN